MVEVLILLIKNNIPKTTKDGTRKHYHEIKRSLSAGVCDWVYLIPTIKTSISGKFFEIEIDMFVFYIFVSYEIVDIDEEE